LRYVREWNQFLDGFNTAGGDINEVFTAYNFNRFSADLELYMPVPYTDYHSLTLRLQGGYIDDPTIDDFFYIFAGGFVGLKGYSYYSIGGTKVSIGTLTYRFPLARNLNLQLWNWHLEKIYLGVFYQSGNAWSQSSFDINDYKSDVGIQLRLDSFSWYMFPTRIFFEAAYPLQSTNFVYANIDQSVAYSQEWRFYFGILFDFDIRVDKRLRNFR
jgi:hypothetical protein